MEDPRADAERFRRMSPEQKLRAAQRLYWSARAIKTAVLRQRHPEWSDAQLAQAVREVFLLRHG
jgi:hypothetical protein